MPSKKQYDMVTNNGIDPYAEIPDEEVFKKGLNFHAKLVGTRDVTRPSSRVEIVAAMRRIRYECKVKSIRKTKVVINISINGIAVALSKSPRKKKYSTSIDDSSLLLQNYPIFRIFYVSHDSQDLQIFSYIARDDTQEVFRCSVFKAYKRSQAVTIVRTIGQAFDMCHKVNSADEQPLLNEKTEAVNQETKPSQDTQVTLDNEYFGQSSQHVTPFNIFATMADCTNSVPVAPASLPANYSYRASVSSHGYKLLHEQLILQTHQTQVLMAEVRLLRNSLMSESAMRLDLQSRIQDLMIQNRELVDHMDVLVNRLAELEAFRGSMDPSGVQRLMRLTSVNSPTPGAFEELLGRGMRYSFPHGFSYIEPGGVIGCISSSQTVPASLSSVEPFHNHCITTMQCLPVSLTTGSLKYRSSPEVIQCLPETSSQATTKPINSSPAPLPNDLRDEFHQTNPSSGCALEAASNNGTNRESVDQSSCLKDLQTYRRLDDVSAADDLVSPRRDDIIPRLKPPPTKDAGAPCHVRNSNVGVRGNFRPAADSLAAKRYSWDCRATVIECYDAAACSTLPSLQRAEKAAAAGLNFSAYTISGNDPTDVRVAMTEPESDISWSNSKVCGSSVDGAFESQLEISFRENQSLNSTAELELSFSDDECFVDSPALKASKKS